MSKLSEVNTFCSDQSWGPPKDPDRSFASPTTHRSISVLILFLFAAGSIHDGKGGSSNVTDHRASPCLKQLTADHVPGHLDPVWILRCKPTVDANGGPR